MYAYFSLSIIDFPLPYLPNGRKFLRLADRLKFAAFYAVSGSLFVILFMSECPVCSRVNCKRGRGISVDGVVIFSLFYHVLLISFSRFLSFCLPNACTHEKNNGKQPPHSQKKAPHKFAALFALEFQRANLRALLFCLRRLRRRPCAGSSVWFCPWGFPVCP